MKPVYFSVDLEFTTPSVARGQIMELGAVCINGAEFHETLPVSAVSADSWVLENQGDQLVASWMLAAKGKTKGPVLEKFVKWVAEQRLLTAGKERKPNEALKDYVSVMAGYCIGYDFALLDKAIREERLAFPFNYEVVDVSSLAMTKFGLPWGFKQEALEQILGMDPNTDKHNSLSDAKHQMEMLKRILELP